VFSAFIEPLEAIARRLQDAGVPFIIAHGGHSPARRRKLSADFKKGPALRDALGASYRQWRDGVALPVTSQPEIQTPSSQLGAPESATEFPTYVHPWRKPMYRRQRLQQLAAIEPSHRIGLRKL
jgi:hypothetical protein